MSVLFARWNIAAPWNASRSPSSLPSVKARNVAWFPSSARWCRLLIQSVPSTR